MTQVADSAGLTMKFMSFDSVNKDGFRHTSCNDTARIGGSFAVLLVDRHIGGLRRNVTRPSLTLGVLGEEVKGR